MPKFSLSPILQYGVFYTVVVKVDKDILNIFGKSWFYFVT